MTKEKIIIVGFLIFFAVECGGSSDSETIRKLDYGDKWPLTVSEATLLCKGYSSVYIYVNELY